MVNFVASLSSSLTSAGNFRTSLLRGTKSSTRPSSTKKAPSLIPSPNLWMSVTSALAQ